MKNKIKKLKFNKVKEFNFREGPYKIIYKAPKDKNASGMCHIPPLPYFKSKSKIYLDPNISEKEFLKTVLDESIHANLWVIDNNIVDVMSDRMATFLWKLGFRLKNK